MDDDQLPPDIRALLARWSQPVTWRLIRRARVNLANALANEEAALPAAPVPLTEPLPPTSDATRRAARDLDALAGEHACIIAFVRDHHPTLLADLPAIPPGDGPDDAEAVRLAERMQGVLGRVLAATRPEWSDALDVRDCMFVLKMPKNRAAAVLKEMAGRGRSRKENRQRWRLNLAALDHHQRARYAEIRPATR